MRSFGITLEQYDQLLEEQDGKCFVCERPQSAFKSRLCVDHNHATGEIRGLLCGYCNLRVIGRHKDPRILERAAAYLRKGTGWIVPPKPKKKRKRKLSRK